MQYQFTNLTGCLGDSRCPLRQYLHARFPNTAPLQAEYRTHAGPIVVRAGTANPAMVGAAFDFQVRFTLDPQYDAALASQAFGRHPMEFAAVRGVVDIAQQAAAAGDVETLARASWACALTTDVYRSGMAPGSLLERLLRSNNFTASAIVAAAPANGLRQLVDLAWLAQQKLLPHLSSPHHLGPTFDGSALCAADADLICDGHLIDLKTRVGRKLPSGERQDTLPAADLYQLIGYALFDSSHTYAIERIGIYSARYGNLRSWPLQTALDIMAGSPVAIELERRRVGTILQTGESDQMS